MRAQTFFPSLDGFAATRQTLQLYSRVAGAIPRAYAPFHPKWWHISLKVQPDGLITDEIELPGGGRLQIKMDLRQHLFLLLSDGRVSRSWAMDEGKPASTLGDEVIAAVEALGLRGGDYVREKFEDDEPRSYDPDRVEAFLAALLHADRIFKDHRATLAGETSPVQLWPHGFDLAFEWFGTRTVQYEEHGEVQEQPAQLNLGFYPEDSAGAYFYSNPWPFEGEALLRQALPAGARWHTEGWQGTMLPYAELMATPDPERRLRDYARQVFELVSPTLMAGWKG